MPANTIPTDFVPADLDATDLDAFLPLVRDLLDRRVGTVEDAERWMLDRSELDAAYSETQARLYIATSCNTGDEDAQKTYTAFLETVPPAVKPLAFELDKKQASFSESFDLPERYTVVARDTVAEVELFREENVPLETELDKLDQKYAQVCGAMSVEFEGEERTLPQMGVFMEDTDRARRESAWRAIAGRRAQDREQIDEIYDKGIALRNTVAQNAGFENFVGYAFKAKHRFDYTPEHCFAFHEACEKVVVPFLRRLDAKRRESLALDALRPWDLAVDVKGRSPLRPFEGGADMVRKSQAAFEALDDELASLFRELGDGGGRVGGVKDDKGRLVVDVSLDLDSRKGKAPGGYQYMLDRSRQPFIFMNAAGLHRDVETMVHEAGHAFHSQLCIDEPLLHYRHSPIEFAEVASMTQELLTMPHWGSYYPDSADLARAQRSQLQSSISLLPWIATIDAFQHWIYTNPGHTRDERTRFWLSLDDRFGHDIDWSGDIEPLRESVWQRQGHLFGAPFYYIEYGIAQLGALGIWLRSLEEGVPTAIADYKKALALGGSRPLPELFEAAGVPFDFGPDIVGRLVDRVEAELEKLPE